MAAVNEAWRVLGDPGRRRQYDWAEAERVSPAAAAPAAPRRAPMPDPEETFSDHTDDVVSHAMRGAPLIAMLVVLLLIFVVTAFAARGAHNSRLDVAQRARRGRLVCARGDGRARGAGALQRTSRRPRRVAVVPLDLSCPANTEYYVAPGGRARVCVAMEDSP